MGCRLVRNQHGYLSWMLYVAGQQWRERTGLKDTKVNRRKLEAVRAEMDAKIKRGRFNYLDYFPDGNRVRDFQPEVSEITLAQYYTDTWLPRQMGRKTKLRDVQQHWRAYIREFLGGKAVAGLSRADMEDLRVWLRLEKKVSIKTTKNIMLGTLSAMLTSARDIDGLLEIRPLDNMKWERTPEQDIDPFTAGERDELLGYFWTKERHWYPYVFTAFWTGMRPSEMVALTWGMVDTNTGRIQVLRSRTLGEINATKTSAASRVISRIPNVIQVLRDHKPLHADRDDYVFRAPKGGAVDQNEFRKEKWTRAIRATGIRPRDFYNCKDTYISLALSAGLNIKWLAENCGTSVAMIEKHYGRYMPEPEDGALERFLGNEKTQGRQDGQGKV